MQIVSMVLCGFVLDTILGDPPTWPHPVKLMGKLIAVLTRELNRPAYAHRLRKFLGLVIWLIVVGSSFAVVWLLFWGISLITWVPVQVVTAIQFIVGTYLCYTCLSIKGLSVESHKIMRSLKAGNLQKAREQVGMIVGRDTQHLSADQVCKATIETVAENTSDGVVAPLFYLLLGGPALGIAYKAVNTLDSMIGYKNEQDGDIGMVSAKIDDVVGFIPARLTWLFLLAACMLLGYDTKLAYSVGIHDRKNHRSPNSGFSESIVAGALKLKLGGPHYYFGELVDKPYIGTTVPNPQVATVTKIEETIRMLYAAAIIGLLALTSLTLIFYA
ncbi:cobalamin biosynthesis protein CobD [Lentilactobacillus fungorum]|uniref:Cobalamin biosynthesis protein CobD n=1 Tax=Lentilactobacillus fungorum TaxID=2201250 RepID=A0ABQ3VZ42_9LACO|nr:adenosylcobinamide-phosphate synthase CbiB [Lentilactobacillus fungorum]GHP13673.1 cobalamin biosynthesis protein CobD [Lentilactobacillus fungorum]